GHWALGINTVRFVHFQLGIWFWEKVSQRGLGGFPHERLANPEGVKGERGKIKFIPFPFNL
ncbi:hypothetical protein VF12_40540, partial [Nostoc linckia z15]